MQIHKIAELIFTKIQAMFMSGEGGTDGALSIFPNPFADNGSRNVNFRYGILHNFLIAKPSTER